MYSAGAMWLGSAACEFTGDEFLAVFFGECGVGAAGGGESGVAGHEPETLGDGPLFGEGHFAEALDLEGVEGFEVHGRGALRAEGGGRKTEDGGRRSEVGGRRSEARRRGGAEARRRGGAPY
jgi:hypothetical protein